MAYNINSWLWKSFKTTGICSRRHEEGRVRSMTPAGEWYIVLSAKKEPTHHSSAGDRSVSFCHRIADFPKNCKTFERRRNIRSQTCCVCLIDQNAPYCPFVMVS